MLHPSPAPPSLRLGDLAAAERFFAPLAFSPTELMSIAYLDADQFLIGVRQIRSLERDALRVPMREIAAQALALDAAAVVIAHNHPSGDPTPSDADRETTRTLSQGLSALQVRLIDHLVVAQGGVRSFRAMGWL